MVNNGSYSCIEFSGGTLYVCACKPTEPCQELEGKSCWYHDDCGEGGECAPNFEIG